MKNQTLFLVLLLILTSSSICFVQDKKKVNSRYYHVTRVTDGDTFWIDDGSEKGLKIRLIGVDAPETRRTRNKEIGYYSQEAKAYLENGTFINAKLVKEGYAMVSTVPPNVKYAEKFVELARKAREKERGLWGDSEMDR